MEIRRRAICYHVSQVRIWDVLFERDWVELEAGVTGPLEEGIYFMLHGMSSISNCIQETRPLWPR